MWRSSSKRDSPWRTRKRRRLWSRCDWGRRPFGICDAFASGRQAHLYRSQGLRMARSPVGKQRRRRSTTLPDLYDAVFNLCVFLASRYFSGTLGPDSVKYLIVGHSANKCSGTNHFSDQRDSASKTTSIKYPRTRSKVHDLTRPLNSWAFPFTRTLVPIATTSCKRIRALRSPISSRLPSCTCIGLPRERRATDTSSEQRCCLKNVRACITTLACKYYSISLGHRHQVHYLLGKFYPSMPFLFC
jgi:hypothetical protein